MMELQLENEQLQQKLKDLKHSNPSYTTSSSVMTSDAGSSSHYYPSLGLDKAVYDNSLSTKTPVRTSFDNSSGLGGPSSSAQDDEPEDVQKKKKASPQPFYLCNF